jgi:MFS family permease
MVARVTTLVMGKRPPMTAQRIIRTYLGVAASTTLAQSLIWGVNTLFLLSAGLDIFQVMLVNAAYTVAQVIFEVPTGVVADTIGRRVSYLLAVGTILVSTLLYVWFGLAGYGLWPFAAASALLGVGYTFYTGAVDAWMVDALHSVSYEGKLEPIFARYGMTFGVSMLVGTTLGGFLGQVDLWIPYVTRAVVLVPAFLLGLLVMRDLGFKGRKLTVGSFGHETRRIATAGITYGLRDRVVRFIMLATLVQGVFFMYGFYSWQKYFLDLLGRDLVWVTGVIAALVGLTQILGNALVGRITTRVSDRGLILMVCTGVSTVAIIGAALVQQFWVAVPLYLVSAASFGISMPVKQGWLNARIPSEQRATIISLDALFGDGGSTVGQIGLGWLSQAFSIPVAWLVGGAVQAIGVPLLGAARRAERTEPADPAVASAGTPGPEVESPGCFGPEPAVACDWSPEPPAAPGPGPSGERAA